MLRYAGNIIDLNCSERLFPEFPELLFGRQPDGEAIYFDASNFAKSKKLSASTVDNFLKSYSVPIDAVVRTAQLNEATVCRMNREAHVLLDSSLLYLFISFVEPRFLIYMFDRMDELFSTGFCVSDSYLVNKTLSRIPMEVLKQSEDDAGEQ